MWPVSGWDGWPLLYLLGAGLAKSPKSLKGLKVRGTHGALGSVICRQKIMFQVRNVIVRQVLQQMVLDRESVLGMLLTWHKAFAMTTVNALSLLHLPCSNTSM
jgi:hypothetical protein